MRATTDNRRKTDQRDEPLTAEEITAEFNILLQEIGYERRKHVCEFYQGMCLCGQVRS